MKRKGGGAASQSNPEKGRAVKCKKNDGSHPSDVPTDVKNTCILYGPGISSKEWKFLKDNYKKHGVQRPFKEKSARSGGKKCDKAVKFDDVTQEWNTMKYHDDLILKKKKGKSE